MKINNVSHLTGNKPAGNKPVSDPSVPGFKAFFDTALQKERQATSASSAPMHSSALSSLAPVKAIEPQDSTPPVEAMERLIDAMDVYQRQLQDPQLSLRDIEPAFERLDRARGDLSRIVDNASVDPSLHGIVEEGLVTTAMELSRFRSGAYC